MLPQGGAKEKKIQNDEETAIWNFTYSFASEAGNYWDNPLFERIKELSDYLFTQNHFMVYFIKC